MDLEQHGRSGEDERVLKMLARDLDESIENIKRGIREFEMGPPWTGTIVDPDDHRG